MSSCDESAASDDRVVNVFEKKKKKRKEREEEEALGFMYRYFNFLNPNNKNKREVLVKRARSLFSGLLAQLVEHWIPKKHLLLLDDAMSYFVK